MITHINGTRIKNKSLLKILNYTNNNPPIKLHGCMVIKNPIETDLSDYEDIPNLNGYMINLKKKNNN